MTQQAPTPKIRQGRIRREWRRSLPEAIRQRNGEIVSHLGLAHHVAGRQSTRGQGEWDDLVQEASLGLIAAVEGFDSSRGHQLSSYAVSRANGQILHFRRDRQSTIRIPWRLRSLYGRGMRLQEQQWQAHGAHLSEDALIARLEVSRERWRQAVQAHEQEEVLSLDGPGVEPGEAAEEVAVEDPQRQWLHQALPQLPPEQRRWLLTHWVEGVSLRALARREGVHPAMLQRVLATALEQLRSLAQVAAEPSRLSPMANRAARAV
ncbi:RNA polymerase sigma factor SigB [Synechococcus sp. WH 8101]|jgi:RNA polymerase sigma-B factor|uniref:sigma-70 family RNA polymerase sigma factor n=1 Tax=Synechococcus sp. WH 8101 TaxID=59932 RepID=UPI001022FE48|nr:sigma-70 family RNA polymerase sigma factor [Synechococcus sp. WH 8101]QBE68732.1 RNA polymerase sigma factor SigB [Synechococcus sp. WH 8101]QNI44952.1 RNA polymerase sigma factor/ type III [Synechococcus sp. WH 8101]